MNQDEEQLTPAWDHYEEKKEASEKSEDCSNDYKNV